MLPIHTWVWQIYLNIWIYLSQIVIIFINKTNNMHCLKANMICFYFTCWHNCLWKSMDIICYLLTQLQRLRPPTWYVGKIRNQCDVLIFMNPIICYLHLTCISLSVGLITLSVETTNMVFSVKTHNLDSTSLWGGKVGRCHLQGDMERGFKIGIVIYFQ